MIHFFNPGHEAAVLNASKYYMAPANVVSMKQELSYLPAWYAASADYVLVNNKPDDDFQSIIDRMNLPEAITIEDIRVNPDRYKGQQINLWGISPQSIHFLNKLNTELQTDWNIPGWNENYTLLTSRMSALKCLESLVKDIGLNYLPENFPVFFNNLEIIEKYISENDKIKFIAKAPYSSSGRGLLWLPQGKLTRTERQILHGHLKKQGMVSIERVLDKAVDFAMEFYSGEHTVDFTGYSLFQTNEKGAYSGNYIGQQERAKQTIYKYISAELTDAVKLHLKDYILKNIQPYYQGFLGIDMMVYREKEKKLLHPCVEINLRSNMGIIAINFSGKYVSANSEGSFHIDFSSQKGDLYNKHIKMKNDYPAVFHNRKLQSGYLALCPVNAESRYRAYVLIDDKR